MVALPITQGLSGGQGQVQAQAQGQGQGQAQRQVTNCSPRGSLVKEDKP